MIYVFWFIAFVGAIILIFHVNIELNKLKILFSDLEINIKDHYESGAVDQVDGKGIRKKQPRDTNETDESERR